MAKKSILWLLWLGFVTYAFFAAPPDQPDTFTLIQDLSTGQWAGLNPVVVTLFNLMGIWPIVYWCLLFVDGKGQKIPAWPFALLSLGVGAFALLPYLALRESQVKFSEQKTLFMKLLDSRWTGALLSLGSVGLVAYGLRGADWGNFVQHWRTSRFIHVMSLDFCLLSLLFPTLLGDDMARRGLSDRRIFWLVALVPLFGPLAYLCLRPSLPESGEQKSADSLQVLS